MLNITTDMTPTGATQWPGGVDPYPGSHRVEHDCPVCGQRLELPLMVWLACRCDDRWWALMPADGGGFEVHERSDDPHPPAPLV